ncbi:ATP-dependent helicase [Candidatus Peregrinibacteria bacterium]|nr:ATP-dependent helicase [Candidatus Peregrinibacteria bacterium]
MPMRTIRQKGAKKDSTLFDDEYQKLNAAQKNAVDTIEGPIMVIAGPGTGKTQVLAMRVAQILRRTQMRPGNILCLTFSVSGTKAMRERLRNLIGVEAYGVTIQTIHSFCNDIILSYPDIFEEWSLLEQISDLERVREMNKIIDQNISLNRLINRKYPYSKTMEILSKISLLKREGVASEDVLNGIAEAYESEMSSLGSAGTKVHERSVILAEKFKEFLTLFHAYQAMLRTTRRYDYEDMILRVLDVLEEEDWILSALQERYQYILVDEFQDTNGAQYRLIDRLTRSLHTDESPNIFVVGDDDQAIYRFQGANLQNMIAFRERFQDTKIIILTKSYRCSASVLHAACSLIEHNTERLTKMIPGLDKNLTSAALLPSGTRPRYIKTPSDLTEPSVIADMVDERLHSGQKPEEIAIFTQTNTELLPLYDTLQSRGIPVEMRGKLDLLSDPGVQQVVILLRAVRCPCESSVLARALGCACFGCHPADLGRLFFRSRERHQSLYQVLLDLDIPEEGGAILYYYNRTSLIHARDVLLNLYHKIETRTVVQTLEALLKESGLIPHVGSEIDPLEYVPLQVFFDRIKYRTYENPGYTVDILLSDIDLYLSSDYPELRLTYEPPKLCDRGVQLMTAHQSKGLEFDTVILSSFREGHWDRRRHPPSLTLPLHLLFGWEKEQRVFEQGQDERRLAYVAITRARKEVIFVCPSERSQGGSNRPQMPSRFLAECGDVCEEERSPLLSSFVLAKKPRVMDSELKAFLQMRVKDFWLSVTSLNRFLENPEEFVTSDLLQTPQAKESSLVYGNAVHFALKEWALRCKRGEMMPQEEFLRVFELYLTQREALIEKERLRLILHGKESLPLYYRHRLTGTKPCVDSIERNVSMHLKDIPLKGKIDRIDRVAVESASVRVIDFKTGRIRSEKEIREGDYFRQLTFYALLLEGACPYLHPEEFVLDFVGERGEKPVERVFSINEPEKKELKQVISSVWKKITNLDFSPI